MSLRVPRDAGRSNLVYGRTGILPVIPADRRDACPTDEDCFVPRFRSGVLAMTWLRQLLP